MPSGAEKLRSLWDAVDLLLADATLPGVLTHKLGPLAANRLRGLGEALPQRLALEERTASIAMLLAIPLLERVRANCDGPLVLTKGPEMALLYPGRARRFDDLDILVDNSEGVQRALLDAGFAERHDQLFTPSWPRDLTDGAHHIPLVMTTGLTIEVHKSPRRPDRLRPLPTWEILDAAVPSGLGVAGISAPAPLHHALMIAAHTWHHGPLQALRDLIDIAAISAQVGKRELDRTSKAWGMGRLWRTTERAIDALFYGGRETFPLWTWSRHLGSVRNRTSFEKHVTQVLGSYWGMPPRVATVLAIHELRIRVKPAPREFWRQRVTRARRT